jgi:hypothetical protein
MGDIIVSWIIFFILILVLPIVGLGLYLIYRGQLKLFLVFTALIAIIVGHFVLRYYMNSDRLVLPGIIRSYGEWFFNRN